MDAYGICGVASETLANTDALLIDGQGEVMCEQGLSLIGRAYAMREGLRRDATQVLRMVISAEKAYDIIWLCEFYAENNIVSKAMCAQFANRIRINRDRLPAELGEGLVYWMVVPLEYYGIDRQLLVHEQQREHDRMRSLEIPIPDSDDSA